MLHSDEEDTRSSDSLGSSTTLIQPRLIYHGEEEELEECGLLKFLLESSDPWGFTEKVLNLPLPMPPEAGRGNEKEQEDMVTARGRRSMWVTSDSTQQGISSFSTRKLLS